MSLEFVDRSSETNPKKYKFKEHIIGIRKTNDPDLWHVICGVGQLDQSSVRDLVLCLANTSPEL